MSLALYRCFSRLAAPAVRAWLAHRRAAGKEDATRYAERFGAPSLARPDGAVVWIHAASVGESLSMLSLIARLVAERPALGLLVTTGTVTSARIMAERLPAGVLHQYAPVDCIAWVRRFLDHWRPGLVLWVESEFWPNLLGEIGARGIPAVLVNARISPASFAGWRRVRGMIGALLGTFSLCLAQSEDDRDKLLALGALTVRTPGNLKFAAEPLPVDEAALERAREAIGSRPCWLAASTHPGEETAIADAHARLAARHDGLLTVIVPRHPARAREIAEAMAARGLRAVLRSTGAAPDAATGIYIADTMGELGLFYRLAPVAFIGGSLVPHGGQNLLEAAKLGCAVIHGPHVTNFRAIADELRKAGASAEVRDGAGIAAEIEALLDDPAKAGERAAAGRAVSASQHDILDRVMDELAPFVDALAPAVPQGDDADAVSRHARA